MPRARQMSDSFSLGLLLAAAGGYLDAYSYCARGEVFATAQTGNMVLLALHAAALRWAQALPYLVPILSFSLGIAAAEWIRRRSAQNQLLHWRQICLFTEILTLLVVGLLPQGAFDAAANLLISFVSALQVQSFRAFGGNACVTTMCTGNLRSGVELICGGIVGKNKEKVRRGGQYFLLLLFFMLGAAAGMAATVWVGIRSVWICCLPLGAGLAMMYSRPAKETV